MFYYQHLPIYLPVLGKSTVYSNVYNIKFIVNCVNKNNQPHKFITLEQIPHPIHSSSDIKAILSAGDTSMHNFPKKKNTHSHI